MLSFSAPTWTVHAPRDWQARFFPVIAKHYAQENPKNGLISAIMGSGKSVLIDELCACVQLKDNECVVVSTSSQELTEDLNESISRRVGRPVGIWYTGSKRIRQITVCCNDSTKQLAERLKQNGKTVLLWICDECHRSQSAEILNAYPILNPQHAIGFTATAFRSCPKETISLFSVLLGRYGVNEAVKDGVVVPWKIEHWRGADVELDESCLEMIKEYVRGPGLVNASTIADAERHAEYLNQNGIAAQAVHSGIALHERRRIMREKLKTGILRCVVHVNTLSEGANYPWLHWLCMRRQVGARVRFIQEVGRLLRSHPGKEIATLLDPHDLFGSFNLSYAEALGEAKEENDEENNAEIDPRLAAERITTLEPALSLALVESVVRSLIVACDNSGILRARKPIKKTERLGASSLEQQIGVKVSIRKVKPFANPDWLSCLEAIGERPFVLRYGFAADLQLALNSITKAGRWPEIGTDGEITGFVEEKETRAVPLVLDRTGQYTADWGKL